MLDGLLGRGFSSKCKSLIKATRSRIDVVWRRKEATQRFLKGNLAQLLSNGLDINAFGRTEEFLAGLNLLACYDFLEQCCEHVRKKLSTMQKQSECPEECREAVGSLMFAAARFSDLPELRDLRDALQERYESSLEHFVNQEFFERLAMNPPPIDKKIQLLEDIALELSIKWDSKGFQQRMMANPSVPAQNQRKKEVMIHDRGTTLNLRKDNETAINTNKQERLVTEKSELNSDWLKAKNGGENSLLRREKPHMGTEHRSAEKDNYDMTPRGRREKGELSSDELQAKNGIGHYLMRKYELNNLTPGQGKTTGNSGKPSMGSEHNTPRRNNYNITLGSSLEEGEKNTPRRENYGNTPVGRLEEVHFSSNGLRVKNGRDNYSLKDELDYLSLGRGDSVGNSHKPHIGIKEKTPRREIYDINPRQRREFTGNKDEPIQLNGEDDGAQSRIANKSPRITQREDTNLLIPDSSSALPPPYVKSEDKFVPPPYVKSVDAKTANSNHGGVSVEATTRKRDDTEGKSEKVRLEEDHSRMRSNDSEKDVSFRDNIPLPKPRSIRRKHSKPSYNRDDPGDSEDLEVAKRSSSSRRRDHHSKKGLQILFEEQHKAKNEEDRKLDKLLMHYSKKPSKYGEEKVKRKMKVHVEGEASGFPTRSVSLPSEQFPMQAQVKVYARANSFEPDRPAGHVHPKLPNYDDLAAQFASLKGR